MCVYVETSASTYLHITLMAVQATTSPKAHYPWYSGASGSDHRLLSLPALNIIYAHCAVQTSQYPRVYSPSLILSVSSSTLRSKLKRNQNNGRKSSELYKGVGEEQERLDWLPITLAGKIKIQHPLTTEDSKCRIALTHILTVQSSFRNVRRNAREVFRKTTKQS